MANKRIFYAIQQVGFAPLGSQVFTECHGVQSLGVTVNINIDTILELGQLAVYDNVEQVPDVQISMQKVLDGYPLIYHLATAGSVSPTLAGRSNAQTIVGWSVFDDTKDSASGNPLAEVQVSGAFVSSLRYTFPVQGTFTEDVDLVATSMVWKESSFVFTGKFLSNDDVPLASASGLGGVNRRQNFILDYPALAVDENGAVNATAGANKCCVLPTEIPGISTSGTNDRLANGDFGAHLQTVTVQSSLGREPLYELGRKFYYHRFISFPVEVTCDIEVMAHTGTLLDFTEEGTQGNGNNTANQTIKIASTEGTFIDLGTKNRLITMGTNGGDTGGGNVTQTWNYRTFNTLTVQHPQDPSGL